MKHAIAIGLLALIVASSVMSPSALAQDAETNARARAILNGRKREQNTFPTVLKNERDPSLVGLSLGIALKGVGKASGEDLAKLTLACAERKDFVHRAMAILAVNIDVDATVSALLADDKPNAKNEKAAALLLATQARIIAQMRDQHVPRYVPPVIPGLDDPGDNAKDKPDANDKKKRKKPKKKGAAKARGILGQIIPTPPKNAKAHIETLLASRDDDIRELAILTAACLRIKEINIEISDREKRTNTTLLAVKLLHDAAIGIELSEEDVKIIFAKRSRPDARYARASPALASYDPRDPAACYALQAIAKAKDARFIELLHEALKHSDIRVQMDAARAIEQVGDASSVPVLFAALKRCSWPVKIHVLSAVGAIPQIDSIEPLIELLGEEKGRFRLDVLYALSSIFGKQHATNVQGWQAHWAQAQGSFRIDLEATKKFRDTMPIARLKPKPTGFFYGLPIYSDSFVYVVDVSVSMRGDKIEDLKRTMKFSVSELAPHARYNIVSFGGDIDIASPYRMIKASEREAAREAIDYFKLNPPTRTYDAIEVGAALPDVDTIVFLSDGAPVLGQLGTWQGIIPVYCFNYRYWPIAMNMVEFMAGSGNGAAMDEFSVRNHGISVGHEDVDINGK